MVIFSPYKSGLKITSLKLSKTVTHTGRGKCADSSSTGFLWCICSAEINIVQLFLWRSVNFIKLLRRKSFWHHISEWLCKHRVRHFPPTNSPSHKFKIIAFPHLLSDTNAIEKWHKSQNNPLATFFFFF